MQAFQCRGFGIWSIRQTDHSQKKVLRVTEGSGKLTTGKLSCGFGLIKMIQDSLGIQPDQIVPDVSVGRLMCVKTLTSEWVSGHF